MAELRDVIAYLCNHYPHKDELSKARLTKMVYLADWRSALVRGRQLTNLKWFYNQFGPYVDDIVQVARTDLGFEVIQSTTIHGGEKELIRSTQASEYESLSQEDKSILDFVIDRTSPKDWNDFIRLVYSTYPIVTQHRFSYLNLEQLATEYKQVRESFEWREASKS